MNVLKEWDILPGDLPHCGITNSIPLEKKDFNFSLDCIDCLSTEKGIGHTRLLTVVSSKRTIKPIVTNKKKG